MNVFEDLIDELKEENLLEETVIALNRAAHERQQAAPPQSSQVPERLSAEAQTLEAANAAAEPLDPQLADLSSSLPPAVTPEDERELYRRRAMDEVSSLQMVEHVLSGIEREHMKMSPAGYDDLNVKKALHKYLQVSASVNSDEHSEAEYALFHETENWFSALSKRDFNISVANVRRFCENSRPVLSSQALMAMARFYRNSPFAESVRGKFDFVMTKLFSREIGDDMRKLLFPRIEMLGHIQNLYSNWASLSLSEPGEENRSVAEAVLRFENFVKEAQDAQSFDELISTDFFNRIRLFKEETSELFFEPAVTAAAIECNVGIGNRFIELIEKEREAASHSSLEERYGYTHDTVISSAASKTLFLLDLLRESKHETDVEELTKEKFEPVERPAIKYERAPVEEGTPTGLVRINKWLVIATIVVLIASIGIYLWSESSASSQAGIYVAPGVDLADSGLEDHLREASKTRETMYALTQPSWDAMTDGEKKEFLLKAFEFAKSKGLKRVNFLNNKGRTVAFASDTRVEVFAKQ